MRFLVAAIVVVTASGMVTAADQWPQFRGPNAGVVADDPGLPDSWSETENVVWKVDVPGLGWSSPIVWDDHVFLTSAISAGKEPAPVAGLYDEHDHVKAAAPQRWMVYDFDFKTGKLRWEREMHQGAPPLLRHIKNSYASETPVTDGERLTCTSATSGSSPRSISRGTSSGRKTSAPTTRKWSSARARRRCCTKIGCSSSTTTRRNLF